MMTFQVSPRIACDGTVNPAAAIIVTAESDAVDFDSTLDINSARQLWSDLGRAIEQWDANADVG